MSSFTFWATVNKLGNIFFFINGSNFFYKFPFLINFRVVIIASSFHLFNQFFMTSVQIMDFQQTFFQISFD